jgi:hypothetical protein
VLVGPFVGAKVGERVSRVGASVHW